MSSFVVSARKYRPVRFEEVVGQEHVSQTLKNALKNDHLAHAFLFCGPRGVGKTTCARILAKVLNCQNLSEDYEPCGTCDSCLAFEKNASFNITELDAASNNSVEHIRALIEQVRFQPQQGKYKIFIIDEVHMLSQQAFNAFLKTLEEPPPYAIFILATTEKHKIIPTILSRCQIFDFKRISVPSMVAHLRSICAEEGISAEEEALHIISQKADGALRDALSIFDRIVAFSGKEIKYDAVIENLNVLDYDYYFKIVDALLTEDLSQILLIFNDILTKGFDGDIFINGLAEHLRNLLVAKDAQTLSLLDRTERLKQRYLDQAALCPTALLLTALDICNTCDIEFRMARNKRLHVEMALIKMTHIPQAIRVSTFQTAEKKTADLSQSIGNTSEAAPVSTAQPPSGPGLFKEETPRVRTVPSPAPTIDKQEPPKDQTEEEAPVKPIEKQVLKKPELANKASSKHSLIKLKGLNSLLEEVQEGVNNEKKEEVQLDLDTIKKAWDYYLEHKTQNSVRLNLKHAELSLEGHELTVKIGSKLAENTLRQERSLMEFLHERLGTTALELNVEVDKAKAPEPPKVQKPLTSKEKYLKMRAVNPSVQTLQSRFGLRPDED